MIKKNRKNMIKRNNRKINIRRHNRKIYAEKAVTPAPDCPGLQTQYCNLTDELKIITKDFNNTADDLDKAITAFVTTKAEYEDARKKWFKRSADNSKEKDTYMRENRGGSAATDLIYIAAVRSTIQDAQKAKRDLEAELNDKKKPPTKKRKDELVKLIADKQAEIDKVHRKNEAIFGVYSEDNPFGLIKLLRDLKNMEKSRDQFQEEYDLIEKDLKDLQKDISDVKKAMEDKKPPCPIVKC